MVILVLVLAVLLAGSVVLNGLFLARRWRRQRSNDYAALGVERFGALPAGEVALLGDSQAQNAPLLSMLTGWRQMGIGGATIRDVLGWADLATRCGAVVVWAGTNDVLIGRPVTESIVDAKSLLDALNGQRVTWLSVPPLVGHDVQRLNNALAELCRERAVKWVDVAPLLGTNWTDDGIHADVPAYLQLAPMFGQVDG